MIKKVTREDTPFERCILCGKFTNIKKYTPVECRRNYIYGAGQICEDCAEAMRENDDPNELKIVD